MHLSAFIPSLPCLPSLHSFHPGAPLSPRPSQHTSANPPHYFHPTCQQQNPLFVPAALATAAALILSTTPLLPSSLLPPALAARGGGDTFLSASGDVNKDPESLLRWSLPISNKPIRELQVELEATVNDLRGLKWQKVESHVKSAQRILNVSVAKILAAVPGESAENATTILGDISGRMPEIVAAVAEKNGEKVTNVVRDVLRSVGDVEGMMVDGFPYQIPSEYKGLPVLKGRATVDVVVKKQGGDVFDIEGRLYKEGNMTLVLDGYSAPISAGSFLDLVDKGFYNGNDVARSDGFIVQAGKPKDGEGYVDASGVERIIPLELFARGDKEPTYGITLEEDGRGAVGTVLPFTSYGTLAMARSEVEPNSASSQFFWFLFEPDLTPAGRNLMDGNWAVFGYTTKGEKFLRGLQKGDVIVSAKVVDGMQNLVR